MKAGGKSGKFALAALAALLIASPALAADHPRPSASASQANSLPAGMPKEWDQRLPIPPGAQVSKIYPSAGVIHSVEFTVPGTFDELVKFYEEQIPKHGFYIGSKIKNAARKVYNANFTSKGALDSVSIYSTQDPGKFTVKISYEVK